MELLIKEANDWKNVSPAEMSNYEAVLNISPEFLKHFTELNKSFDIKIGKVNKQHNFIDYKILSVSEDDDCVFVGDVEEKTVVEEIKEIVADTTEIVEDTKEIIADVENIVSKTEELYKYMDMSVPVVMADAKEIINVLEEAIETAPSIINTIKNECIEITEEIIEKGEELISNYFSSDSSSASSSLNEVVVSEQEPTVTMPSYYDVEKSVIAMQTQTVSSQQSENKNPEKKEISRMSNEEIKQLCDNMIQHINEQIEINKCLRDEIEPMLNQQSPVSTPPTASSVVVSPTPYTSNLEIDPRWSEYCGKSIGKFSQSELNNINHEHLLKLSVNDLCEYVRCMYPSGTYIKNLPLKTYNVIRTRNKKNIISFIMKKKMD